MIPTPRTTLGLKGHRPVVGHLDCHDLLYVFGALNVVTGRLTTRLMTRHKPIARPHHMQQAFARHMRDIARTSPVAHYPRVVLVIDNAPWHKGALVTAALKAAPPIEVYRLPSYSPQLQVIERLWKVLRRRQLIIGSSRGWRNSARRYAIASAITKPSSIEYSH